MKRTADYSSDSDSDDTFHPVIFGPDIHVEDAIEAVGFGRAQIPILIAFGVALALNTVVLFLAPFLTIVLRCEWTLTDVQAALFTILVFLGAAGGGFVLGPLADHIGRRPILILSSVAAPYFLLLLGYSPTIHWLLINAPCIGFFCGGVHAISPALGAEFIPSKWRAAAIVLMLAISVSASAFVINFFSWLLLARLGWRHFVIMWSFIIGILSPCAIYFFIPRSPRYLLLCGFREEARIVLNRLAYANKQRLIKLRIGPLTILERSLGDPRLLFQTRTLILVTVCQMLMWFTSGFAYVGSVLIAVELPGVRRRCIQDLNHLSKPMGSSSFIPSDVADGSFPFPFHNQPVIPCVVRHVCYELPYETIILAALGEIPGVLFNFLLLDLLGRRYTLIIFGSIGVVIFLVLTICTTPVVAGILLGVVRASLRGFHAASIVYAVEIYPCVARVTAAGILLSFYRIGGVLSPLVGQVMLVKDEVISAIVVFAMATFFATVTVFFLPVETKGKPMAQDYGDMNVKWTSETSTMQTDVNYGAVNISQGR